MSIAAYTRQLLVLAIAPSAVGAQTTTPDPPRPVLRAEARTGDVRLDGKLDEADWGRAEAATDFVQRYPAPGAPATMRTEVRVLFDREALWIGARMYDPHPDSIAAPLARRDPDGISSDWFDVVIDSYHDRRTAFRFGVNPAGTKLDVYHFNDNDDDASWDATWDAATRVDSLGWTAELRIPLSQLRFRGGAGEQVWGLNFYRAGARRDEWSHWAAFLPSAPGFVSSSGTLRGLVGLDARHPVELQPYVSSRVHEGAGADGDLLATAARGEGAAGLDVRAAIGRALSLGATVNPDFGQVELDPAVLNLTTVETFLPEKRPFFLEGAGIFEFGRLPGYAAYGFSRVVHSRRIGRAPQVTLDASWSDAPAQTRILGAAKISGQPAAGWSLGVLDALTARERARWAEGDGRRGRATVEPLTNYLVARTRRDFDEGRGSLGLLATAVDRSLDSALAPLLRARARTLGVDASRQTRDRRWTVAGFAIASDVRGSAEAIAATQRSSVHYEQRPDAAHLRYDSTRTALGGSDAGVGVAWRGARWFASAQARATSPGFEPNDVGYLTRADARSLAIALGTTREAPRRFVRSAAITLYATSAWSWGGDHVYGEVGASGDANFPRVWYLAWSASVRPPVVDDRLTRGGPAVRMAAEWLGAASLTSDARRTVIATLGGAVRARGARGRVASLEPRLVVRPRPSLQVSVAPAWEWTRDGAQYVRTVADAAAAATYGRRFVFARLEQRTFSASARLDWTLTTTFSIQLFAQPLVSTGRLRDWGQLAAAGRDRFLVYGRDLGTATPLGGGRTRIVPDESRPESAFVLDGPGERSFLSRSVRANAVVRWEYRTGSSLYLVWQQTRDAETPLAGTSLGAAAARLLAVPAENTVAVTVSHRLAW